MKRARVLVAALTISAAGFAAWVQGEGDGPVAVRDDGVEVHQPYVPMPGDVPTIGHGSTRYEDGRPVRLTDPPITRERAVALAHNLQRQDERAFAGTLPGVALYQEEFDLYLDFVGQYGLGNWRKPMSPRTWLLRGDYPGACEALLNWRFQAGRDCRQSQNWGPKGCKGVWTRQLERHKKCLAAQ